MRLGEYRSSWDIETMNLSRSRGFGVLFCLFSLTLALCANIAEATPHGGSVHVHGYTRRDGTHVSGYTRSKPSSASHISSTHIPALSHQRSPSLTTVLGNRSSSYCRSCARDSNGKIQRNESAKRDFMKQSGYPHGRPGYVVDHIVALKRGGKDVPSNMQWQTVEEARAKDKWE
jgi:hypothetical protein